MFLHFFPLHSKIFVQDSRIVLVYLFFHVRYQTSYASKWLAAATVIALVCPLFLTVQAIIPLQRDILEVKIVFLYYH